MGWRRKSFEVFTVFLLKTHQKRRAKRAEEEKYHLFRRKNARAAREEKKSGVHQLFRSGTLFSTLTPGLRLKRVSEMPLAALAFVFSKTHALSRVESSGSWLVSGLSSGLCTACVV